MRTRTVVERIGENMGPIDWAYDFRAHFDSMGTSDQRRDEACVRKVAMLRTVVEALAAGKRVRVGTYSDLLRDVLDTGMYDGWPYWKPTPSLLIASPLGGGEWTCFYSLNRVLVVEKEEQP